MPAAYIHENIAKKALSKIADVPGFISGNMDAFELGAQGPDFFFYYNILKFWDKDDEPNQLGNDMHNKRINDFFKAVLPAAKERGGAAPAWMCGFVTHYAADTTIHPFVYARTDNPDDSRNLTGHLVIESQFDTWYYRERQGKKGIPRQAICTKRMTAGQKSDVAHTLSHACDEIYSERRVSKEQMYKAICDMASVIAVLYSPLKIKHAVFLLIEKILKKPHIVTRHAPAHNLPGYDFLNLAKDTWLNPWDKSIASDKSFPELFDMAADKAAGYIKTITGFFEGSISLESAAQAFGNNSYASGLPVKKG